ncbi:MAG: FUSC family protein [Corynebacterium sp.]|nr:FUSC family protein [Corynebacterium sp.]
MSMLTAAARPRGKTTTPAVRRYVVNSVRDVTSHVDLGMRLGRVRTGLIPALQGGLAAGLAYWFAFHIVGHTQPFFAPMAAIIVLAMSGGGKIKRATQIVIGASLGVGMGDLIISQIGSGAWQIAAAVAVSLLLAIFIDDSVLVTNQTAIGAVLIATIMPPGTSGGFDRMGDALVGGVVGLIVVGLIPTSPFRNARQEVGRILGTVSSVCEDVSLALTTGDTALLRAALTRARGTQGRINAMLAAAQAGAETVKVSPFKWRDREKITSLTIILAPVDNAIRTTRVLVRRALVLQTDHNELDPRLLDIIDELAEVAAILSNVFLNRPIRLAGSVGAAPFASSQPAADEAHVVTDVVHRLRLLGSRAGIELVDGNVLSAYAVLAQVRSLIVDLLMVAGMSYDSARAVLIPTTEEPAIPPEQLPGTPTSDHPAN